MAVGGQHFHHNVGRAAVNDGWADDADTLRPHDHNIRPQSAVVRYDDAGHLIHNAQPGFHYLLEHIAAQNHSQELVVENRESGHVHHSVHEFAALLLAGQVQELRQGHPGAGPDVRCGRHGNFLIPAC